MEKKVKNKREVDRSHFFPGEEAMIAEVREKILAARAKKEAEAKREVDRSPLIPGEKVLLERMKKKALAARALKVSDAASRGT